MKLTPFSVDAEFKRFCGPDVTYVEHEVTPKGLVVKFTINNEPGKALGWIRNGTTWAMRAAAKQAAKRAFDLAYVATGKRAADMAKLLQGKRHAFD